MNKPSDLPWLSDVVLRSIDGWYDGPRSGLAEHAGRLHWYSVSDDAFDEVGNYREYVLYELSDAEIEAETQRANDYRRLVGTHHDVDERGRLVRVVKNREGRSDQIELQPESSQREFFATYPPSNQRRYDDHPIVGRFRGRDLP